MIEKNIDLLGINLVQMKKNVVNECQFEDVIIDYSINDIKKVLNEAIDIEVEEDTKSLRERGFVICKNDEGTHISIRNVHISIKIILETLAALQKMTPIAISIFLCNLLQQLRVELDRRQMAVYMILYRESKSVEITDENLLNIIQNEIVGYGYEKMGNNEILDIVNFLYNKRLVEIDDGIYKAAEKIYC